MAKIIIYDENNLRVTRYLKSANTPSYAGRGDVLINPLITATQPQKYWKANPSKNSVGDLSSQEIRDIVSGEQAAALSGLKETAKSYLDDFQDAAAMSDRAILLTLLKGVNDVTDKLDTHIIPAVNQLRGEHSFTPDIPLMGNFTRNQLRNYYQNQLDNNNATGFLG